MSEQLGIDGSFRYSTTVYGYIRSVLTTAKLMNNLRKAFLTYSTFSSHKYRQVCRSNLSGYVYRPVQVLRIADNPKSEFYCLNVCLRHNL